MDVDNAGGGTLTHAPIRIRPGKRSFIQDLREIRDRRELLYVLIWRDLKVRYKQAVLGVGWAIVQPVLTTVVFAVFLGLMVRVPSDGVPYPLFAYSGILAWLFLSQTIAAGSQSLSANAHLINKVYFPRIMLPLANACVRLVDLTAAGAVLFGLMLYYRTPFGIAILWCPLLALLLAILAFSLSALLASLQLRFRDIGSLLPVAMQAWMFASPIVYPSSLVPREWRGLYFLNPIAGIVENLRAALFGLPMDTGLLLSSTLIILIVSTLSIWAFYATSKDLADIF